jgi:transposase
VRQTQYQWCYVFTAVCPATGEAVGLVLPHADTEAANALLEELSRRLSPDVHAVLIWDGAGYHTGGSLRVPANITLVPLPPYAPELNPVENLWHYLRSHHWANRVYADYDALVWAAVDSWRAVCLRPELVRTVCAAPYLEKRRN